MPARIGWQHALHVRPRIGDCRGGRVDSVRSHLRPIRRVARTGSLRLRIFSECNLAGAAQEATLGPMRKFTACMRRSEPFPQPDQELRMTAGNPRQLPEMQEGLRFTEGKEIRRPDFFTPARGCRLEERYFSRRDAGQGLCELKMRRVVPIRGCCAQAEGHSERVGRGRRRRVVAAAVLPCCNRAIALPESSPLHLPVGGLELRLFHPFQDVLCEIPPAGGLLGIAVDEQRGNRVVLLPSELRAVPLFHFVPQSTPLCPNPRSGLG
jgi:hypothetical protein